MGGNQSAESGGPREVTVEERLGEDGQPQIIVTQDFLEYVQDRQEEEEEEGDDGDDERWNEAPPPPYQERFDDIPHLTTDDMISSAMPTHNSSTKRHRERRDEEINIWQRKYMLEKEKNSELKHITNNEFTKTVAEVRQKFIDAEVPDMLPVCEDRRNDVLQCYHRNPSKPLLCSQEVKAFTSCVEEARQRLLQKESQEQ